jgi:hypothetical protein
MGVETDIYYCTEKDEDGASFCSFTDFDSLAQYEEVFLGNLLHDSKYLQLAANAVDAITHEPLDELFVRLKPDDYFMNLGVENRPKFTFETAKADPSTKRRYRRERHYSVSKGRLREAMRINFEFIEAFYKATGNAPEVFCTRFSAAGIGSSKMYFDVDDCPVCDPAFIEQDHAIQTKLPGLLMRMPTDRWHVRITEEHANFTLSALSN